MLELRNVEAFYGQIQVLFGIDLEVGDGDIVALLGTNGAGKTTILRVVSGILPARAGEVRWDGQPLGELRPEQILRRGVVQMPGGRGVFPGMTVEENLEIGGFLYGKDRKRLRQAVDRAFELFPFLAERRREIAGSLSGGQQQMLTLAKSFVLSPRLLLIDELSLGLAPKIVEDLLGRVRGLNEEGVSVLIVDQHVDLALDIATRAYFIERGEIRYAGPAEDLRGRDDLLRSVFLRGKTAAVAATSGDGAQRGRRGRTTRSKTASRRTRRSESRKKAGSARGGGRGGARTPAR